MLHHFYNNRKTKKGFTLVEVIVVLVILAILAAILIPSMVGWIGKADEKSVEIQFNVMRKALISGLLEIDLEKATASDRIAIPGDKDKPPSESQIDHIKLEKLVTAYLDPEMENKYVIFIADKYPTGSDGTVYNSLHEFINKCTVYYYYPNGKYNTPYYMYNNGTITKVE